MTKTLEGRTALVTGARSVRGIGFAAAEKLADAGANVVITSRFTVSDKETATDQRFQEFQALAEQIRARGVRCLALSMDVTDRDAVDQAVRETNDQFGRLDIVFNNAGLAFGESFENTTAEQFSQCWDVNVQGTANVSQAAIPFMRAAGGGAIINNASIYGLGGAASVSAYVATKHAVVGLTKSLALELGADKIRVNAVCPGMVVTEMGDLEYQLIADMEGIPFDDAKQALADQNVLKRGAEPGEIGDAVVYLASDQASFVSGIAMPIAAGQMVGL